MRYWPFLFIFCLWFNGAQAAALKPLLGADWLIYQSQRNQLVPYLPDYHDNARSLHQWVTYDRFTSPKIELAARKNLCLFLDNKLVFLADSTARYTLDLSASLVPGQKHLLTVWHPDMQPNYLSFRSVPEKLAVVTASQETLLELLPRQPDNRKSTLILFMIVIGLLYGSLRLTFPTDFASIFRASNYSKVSTLDEGLLSKPIGNWSSVLFILAFALSFALLITAIHTQLEDLALLNQLFMAAQADLISKVLLYTFIIFLFVIFKYLLLQVMGFIFGVEEVVLTQYREFLRTLLAMGGFLPLLMLLYLAFASSAPGMVYLVANISITILLIFTVIRTFLTVSKKFSLQNLHLFSYLCATEVIPLMILLKLIVFV